jgi:hypothetical protein
MLATAETAHPRCKVRDLGVLGYAAGLSHWTYKTNDSSEDVQRPDYFAAVRDMMGAGDWIYVSASDGPLILWARDNAPGVTLERVR